MSYLTSAVKQSENAMNPELAYVEQRQHAQLAMYKRLSLVMAGVVLSAVSLSAGFYFGKLVPLQPLHTETTSSNLIVDSVSLQKEQVTSVQATSDVSSKVEDKPSETVPKVQQAPQTAQQDSVPAHPEKHYQWMSVQIGYDLQGNPIYEQQLVPVDAISNIPDSAPKQTRHDQSATQSVNEFEGFQVLGKQLEPEAEPDELEGVSDELKAAFDQAVKDTESSSVSNTKSISATKDSAEALPIDMLPLNLRSAIPSMVYQAHIYATEASKRWIKINNRPLYEGDSLGALTVVEITPEQTLFDFDGIEFSLEAMQDWRP
ncbi:general secretion pathway protein GspB [Pseudoalteromonas sp. T1lg65]|uniref:general secretion pathway protein GspB n=1 Tax=Pseudoalteromonas sp. T1lg65 TaxID=2077101 RepID=UPI003F798922